MRRWIRGRLAAAIAVVGCGACDSSAQRDSGTLASIAGGIVAVADFESQVKNSIEKAGVTGLSVAILNDGKPIYTKQFGWKDKDAATTLDDSTVFNGASLSKTVFAYLMMLLAEEGRIDLDRPLQEYLPKPLVDFPRYADLAGDNRYRALTARMALSHTTGFPNWRFMAPDGRLQIQSEPGRRFSYSGEGIDLLQMVVESITGTDLESLAREKIFAPFGMSRTSYVWQERFAADVAAPHNQYQWSDTPNHPSTPGAAGSMTTTARDYAQFLAGVLAVRGKPKESVDKMLTPVISIRTKRMFGPESLVDTVTANPIQLSWGLGWGLLDTPYGRAFFHTGHASGAQNYAVVYRDRGIGIVLLSNSDNFESVAREIVAAGIGDTHSPFDWLGYTPFDSAQRKPAPPRRVAIQVRPEVIAPYAGKYQLDQGKAVVFIKTEGAHLYVSDDGTSWDEADAASDSVFFFKGRDVTLTFQRDANSKVSRIDVSIEGATMVARRIE